MLSFPSTLNEARYQYGSDKYRNTSFDIERLKSMNINTSVPTIQEQLKPKQIVLGNYQQHLPHTSLLRGEDKDAKPSVYENPNMISYADIATMKDYDWIYNAPVRVPINEYMEGKDKDTKKKIVSQGVYSSPSMFNPMHGVNAVGMTANVPLLNGVKYEKIEGLNKFNKTVERRLKDKENLTDCTIRELCKLSLKNDSILGMAKYKYADFMYCRDLGKISNNYLITLRRFAHPVGDHIFELTNPEYIDGEFSFQQEGDIGRLVTWFGTSENRLEDICKFEFHSTWKELGSDMEQQNSVAGDETSGMLGMLSNTFSNEYTAAIKRGVDGHHSMWTWLGDKLKIKEYMVQGEGKNNELLGKYDNNRIYNPKNTVQSTHIYEGKIEFTHEFTLTFNYKLRAYDNINPKSAFLDLIGNITEVTGRRGQFWGGSRRLIGPEVDYSFFDKAEKIIDNRLDELGGLWKSFQEGGMNFQSIIGSLSDYANTLIGNVKKETGINNAKDAGEKVKTLAEKLKENFGEVAGGYLKNALGRPKKIAWQSLLDGSNVGLWHVTIGNPKNPILAMGNLIVTSSEIRHSGPLGLDDFPSDLTVTVTLKHARPRDITDITRMYTKGTSAIYFPLVNGSLEGNNRLGDFLSSYGLDSEQTQNILDSSKLSLEAQQKGTTQNSKSVNEMPKVIQNASKIDMQNINDKNIADKIYEMNNYSSVMALLAANEVA